MLDLLILAACLAVALKLASNRKREPENYRDSAMREELRQAMDDKKYPYGY